MFALRPRRSTKKTSVLASSCFTRSLSNESIELLTQRAARPGESHQGVGLGNCGFGGRRRCDVELQFDLIKQNLERAVPIGGNGRH